MDLKSRLYDKGFNLRTMPSVKRNDAGHLTEKVLTANLTSL